MYLESLPRTQTKVGYGQLGTGGQLGYEGKSVQVEGKGYEHALSTHPPARLCFRLDGRFKRFRCQVALNDDVKARSTHATFTVQADGAEVATAHHVRPGEGPRSLEADITDAKELMLEVKAGRWEYCHALWLDPTVDRTPAKAQQRTLLDCLHRAEITVPAQPITARRCIATVVTPGYEALLDDMLGSLYANGHCQEARVVVFTLKASEACRRVVDKYNATAIDCQPHSRINATVKAALYSVARVVDAEQYLCLDADMLVLGDLRPIYAALDACPPGAILVCREGNGHGFENLMHVLTSAYGGKASDLQRILGTVNGEGAYSLIVNDGLFAGSRAALLALDDVIRAMPGAVPWVDQYRNNWWRNQLIFNLALARMDCGVEANPTYNVQLHVQDATLYWEQGTMQAKWSGKPVRVLHFSGRGRKKYPKWRGLFAKVDDPLASQTDRDSYHLYLRAVKGWVGRYGVRALAWSFYGTTNARDAVVRDASTMPLMGLLHYIIRANGCVRVFETGTARGVSAACLASAVAHREDARVVTFDHAVFSERTDLWAALPQTMQNCIEPRTVDSLQGMEAAIAAGECYDAALLDTIHTEDHVWAEFQLATQLVGEGGLILIHDVQFKHGTVGKAVDRIKAAGYGVVRLWTAESGVREDDNLGLAVVENRRRDDGASDPKPD